MTTRQDARDARLRSVQASARAPRLHSLDTVSARLAQIAEVKHLVDAAQQVISRHVIVEVEGEEELVLRATSLTHHRNALPLLATE